MTRMICVSMLYLTDTLTQMSLIRIMNSYLGEHIFLPRIVL